MKCPQLFMNEAESTVCESEKLLGLDRQMSELYRAVRDLTPNIGRDQKAWSKERKNCKADAVCIESLYHARIELFQSKLQALLPEPGQAPAGEDTQADAAHIESSEIVSTSESTLPSNNTPLSPERVAVAAEPRKDAYDSSKAIDQAEQPSVRSTHVGSKEISTVTSIADMTYILALALLYPVFVSLSWKYAHLVFSKRQLWGMSPATLFVQRVVAAAFAAPLVDFFFVSAIRLALEGLLNTG